MHYKAIFFDWGGVIAQDAGPDFLGNLLLTIGATPAQKQEIYDTYMRAFMRGKITEAAYWQALREKYGLTIHDTISEEFMKWKGLEANQEILDLARQAKAKGVKIAILSNVIEPTYNAIKKAGFYDLFDAVIASCKVGSAKPEEAIYKIALERVGVSAEESVFIDDQQKCLTPADALGFKTILAQDPQQLATDLRALLADQ